MKTYLAFLPIGVWTVLVALCSFCQISLAREVIGEPLVFESPAKEGDKAKVFCLARIQNGENIGEFVAPFNELRQSCSKDQASYTYPADDSFRKGGIGTLDGPKSDSMVIDSHRFVYSNYKYAVVFAYPIAMPDSSETRWEAVCIHRIVPEGSDPKKTEAKLRVCRRESPVDPIKDDKIDEEIKARSIKCPYPERCKEREIPLMSVPTYVAKKTNPHATDTALTQANPENPNHPDSSKVKRPAAGGRSGQLPLAPQK